MGLRVNPHTKYYLIPFCVERNVRRFKKSHYMLQEENCRGPPSSDSSPAFLMGRERRENLSIHKFLVFPLNAFEEHEIFILSVQVSYRKPPEQLRY